ncbi:MAG: heat-inducible transcriptional repressor HrcA [Coprobacillus sp.]|nr:heat-inducible transcriptional repressor HrcA [Coprobacillus sp.]
MKGDRLDLILKCIVEYFIKNAEPVGSKTLIEEYHLPYSSATVRNDMMELEEEGLIEKTHMSSGRVPSSKGYRYYCDHLRNDSVDEDLKESLALILANKKKSIEETIEASCEILSHMTSLVSVVLGSEEKERLASISLVQINERTVTSVFVTDKGYVENKTFIVDENLKAEELVDCVKLINDRLVGTPVDELVEKMEALKPILSDYITDHDVIYQALLETFIRYASDRMSLYGREELFNNPEYASDADRLTRVLRLLNDSSSLKEVDEGEDLEIHIGDLKDNPDVSMVSAKIKIGKEGENTIALVGPSRMDYDKALSALKYIADKLNEHFADSGDTTELDKEEGESKDGEA